MEIFEYIVHREQRLTLFDEMEQSTIPERLILAADAYNESFPWADPAGVQGESALQRAFIRKYLHDIHEFSEEMERLYGENFELSILGVKFFTTPAPITRRLEFMMYENGSTQ